MLICLILFISFYLCLHSYSECMSWVLSCMARCCVWFALSWAAFCTVWTEVHLSQRMSGWLRSLKMYRFRFRKTSNWPEQRNNERDDPARPVNVGRRCPGKDKRATVVAAVFWTAGGPLYVHTRTLGEGSPKVLGRKRVIPSELCIDKGRHHSAFHNSVNNAHKNRKKTQKQASS